MDSAGNNATKINRALRLIALNLKELNLTGNGIGNGNVDFLDLHFIHNDLIVDLTNNQIRTIDFDKVLKLPARSRSRPIVEGRRILFKGNPFNCDCRLIDFWRFLNGNYSKSAFGDWFEIGDKHQLECQRPNHLQGRKLLSMKGSEFKCRTSELKDPSRRFECPRQCECFSVPYLKRIDVKCGNGIPFSDIKIKNPHNWTTTLEISDKGITELDTKSGIPLTFNELDLSGNRLRSIDLKRNSALKRLRLNNNSFEYFEEDALKFFSTLEQVSNVLIDRSDKQYLNFLQVWLGDNPFPCSCSSIPLRNFVRQNRLKIGDAERIRIDCGQSLGQRHIVRFNEDELCTFR